MLTDVFPEEYLCSRWNRQFCYDHQPTAITHTNSQHSSTVNSRNQSTEYCYAAKKCI